MQKKTIIIILGIVLICVLSIYLYQLPAVNERLGWRMEAFIADIKYALNPPEQMVFTPGEANDPNAPPTLVPTETPTLFPLPSPTQTGTVATLFPTPIPSPTPTPIPGQIILTGFVHEYQMWNNCGPANLAMALSYWGWKGDQRDVAAYLKPNKRDKNVMPYEMAQYVLDETEFNVVVRVGGDLKRLKDLVSAGYPVIVEKGFEGAGFQGWMGHYEVVNGYDDDKEVFYVQDSYKGPDLEVPYEELASQWRAFNYLYLVVYPNERDPEVVRLLDIDADKQANFKHAEMKARAETEALEGRDLFFALFNLGTNLVYQQDYTGAATAYDAAFANYPTIPEEKRPWRIMWYQTGPYFAYYYTARYQDVIDLATTTLDAMSEPILEESYYWRGKAKLALGDNEGAIKDFEKSLKVHPGFEPSVIELRKLGIEP